MTKTVNQSEVERKLEKATIKIRTKFLQYTPVVMAYLNNDEEGRI